MSSDQISEFEALPDEGSDIEGVPRWRRVLREVTQKVTHKPVQNISIIVTVVLAVVGLAVGLRHLLPEQLMTLQPRPVATLADALEALDNEDFDRARGIAADLRMRKDPPPEDAGGPAYVLGVVMAHDAELEWEERERKLLLLLAARYLEEAREAGFPVGRHGHALYVLGKAHHDAGRFADALEPLHAALELYIPAQTEIHGLLASSYLSDAKPQYDKALDHNRAYLADDALGFDERQAALLVQAEIQFRFEDYVASDATLSLISPGSEPYPRSLLLQARIVMHAADEAARRSQFASTPDAGEAIAGYAEARELLGRAQDLDPASALVARQAQYLTGLTYRRTAPLRPTGQEEVGEFRAAAAQFGRTRRTFFDTAEGVSASLEEAEVLQLLGEDAEAVQAFRRTLRYAGDLSPYNNSWTSIDELQSRVEAAYRVYREAGELAHAVAIASGMAAVFPRSQAVRLQAEAQQAQAVRLAEGAVDLSQSQAELQIQESRTEHRKAGSLYAELAKLRFATREYPGDLWNAAENYMAGHDYGRAVTYYKRFLDTQDRQARPPALTAIGKALLALNKPGEALPWLEECVEFFPRDPHSYRARIIAAQAHRELANLEQAKLLLEGNLAHDGLTPRSVDWRESLFALGDLHFMEGLLHETRSRLQGVNSDVGAARRAGLKQLELAQASFRQTVRRLSEAVQRDPDAPQALEARYRIAEAHRHAAKLPRKRLPTVTIDTTRKRLNAEINRELGAAEVGYAKLIDALNKRQEQGELTAVERRILRNCYFARADALYDMARYDEAIQAYSTATNRYQHEPESLEAYVQIANCHRRKNRPSEARGTLEQAKVVLNRIRPDADFRQTTRYDRKEWADLLDWLATL